MTLPLKHIPTTFTLHSNRIISGNFITYRLHDLETKTTTAIKNFQKFFHLPVTGELDEETIEEMKTRVVGTRTSSSTQIETSGLLLWVNGTRQA